MNCFSAGCQILSSSNKSACIDVHIGLCWCGALFCARTPFVSSLGNILYMLHWSQHIGLSVATLCQWQAKKTFINVFEVLQLILCTLPSLTTKCTWGCFHCESTLKKKKNWTIFKHSDFLRTIWCTAYQKRMVLPCSMPFVCVWLGSLHMPENALRGQSTGRVTTCCA